MRMDTESFESYVVSSLVIEAFPEYLEELQTDLIKIDGLEIHEVEDNKIVVSYECESLEQSRTRMEELSRDERIIGLNLVYLNYEEA